MYYVHKDTSNKDLREYICSKGIVHVPLHMTCVSNLDSMFKSYKLTASLSDSKAALNTDI